MLRFFVISRQQRPACPDPVEEPLAVVPASSTPSVPQELLLCKFSSPVTLLDATLMYLPASVKCCKQTTYGPPKPFRCNTYKKQGEGVPIMVNQVLETSHPLSSATLRLCAPPSILRTHFQVPYPATPLFATLTKTAGVCTNNSHSGTSSLQAQP